MVTTKTTSDTKNIQIYLISKLNIHIHTLVGNIKAMIAGLVTTTKTTTPVSLTATKIVFQIYLISKCNQCNDYFKSENGLMIHIGREHKKAMLAGMVTNHPTL